MSQYLVFKFEGIIELDFQTWCKSFKIVNLEYEFKWKKKKVLEPSNWGYAFVKYILEVDMAF